MLLSGISNQHHFNSQPHEEADKSRCTEEPCSTYFNSQPHEEADGTLISPTTPAKHFNSQPHEEADRSRDALVEKAGNFNSQPHEEADGNFRQKYIYLKLFFTLIAHINLVFYSNHYIVNFFLVKYTHFLVRMS